MVEEIVSLATNRVELTSRLKRIIRNHKEILSGQERLNPLHRNILITNLHNARGNLRTINIEQSGQRVHVKRRIHFRSSEKNQVLRAGAGRHLRRIIARRHKLQVPHHGLNLPEKNLGVIGG